MGSRGIPHEHAAAALFEAVAVAVAAGDIRAGTIAYEALGRLLTASMVSAEVIPLGVARPRR